MKSLKSRVRSGEAVLGCWLSLASSVTAEMVGLAGFDWALIDLEHGPGTESEMLYQLQALKGTGASAVVRVEAGKGERIHRVLDQGAEGVMAPMINTAEEAAVVVDAMRYPPKGSRGVARMVRAAGYGKFADDYIANADENLLGIVQIETAESLHHLDAIAALDGIDVLFIGPSDLSMSLGIFGQFDHPKFLDAVSSIAAAAARAGKASGILIMNPDDYLKYYNQGLRFIACGSDGGFVTQGARAVVERIRASVEC